jgi:hypothetical protein
VRRRFFDEKKEQYKMTTPKRRVKIRMRPSSPLLLQRPHQRASPTSKRATPKRRPTTNTPARTLCDDVFTQWCAAINERGPVCDFEQLSRFPGDDRRMWTTIASPGDGHCFYHSVLTALRRMRIHPELTRIDGSEPRSTVAIRQATLLRLRERLREYREKATTNEPPQFRADVRKYTAEIRNAAAGLEDARANRGTSHWAVDVEINAVSTALRICIAVWEGESWVLSFPEPSGYDLADRTQCRHVAYITHVSDSHFDTLVPAQSYCARPTPTLDRVDTQSVSQSAPPRLSSDLQRLVDERTLTLEQAVQMMGGRFMPTRALDSAFTRHRLVNRPGLARCGL